MHIIVCDGPYYSPMPTFNNLFNPILKITVSLKAVERNNVRGAAQPLIDKQFIVEQLNNSKYPNTHILGQFWLARFICV